MRKYICIFFLILAVLASNAPAAEQNTSDLAAIQKLAEQGNAEAQFNLGVMYAYGHGAPKNETRALEWFQKAADQGYVQAQVNLGLIHYEGQGVLQDRNKACSMWRDAGEQGHKGAILLYNQRCI